VFIIRKTVKAALWYFIIHLYKQSSHWQNVFDISMMLLLLLFLLLLFFFFSLAVYIF